MIIYTIGDKAKNVTPQVVHVEGDPDHPINRGTLCPKGASLQQDILNDRPHIGGALGAALLKVALQRKWVIQELDSRALSLTSLGRREMQARFGVHE